MNDRHRFDPKGLENLANAIVIQAAKDYRNALKRLKKNHRNKIAMTEALEVESFFDGDWIKALTDIDGGWLKDKLRKEVREDDSK